MQIFNQFIKPYTKMGCSGYTYMGILSDHYHLHFYNEEVIALLKKEEEAGFWNKLFGAYFRPFYNSSTDLINKEYGLDLRVHEVSINSYDFIEKLEQGFTFGLGMRKANSIYKDLVKDGELSTDDILKLEDSKDSGHNHRIRMIKNKLYIIESLNFEDNTIEITLKSLREAVLLGIYYDTARTIIEVGYKTKCVGEYLIMFTKYPRKDIKETISTLKEYLDIAGSIYLKYKSNRG